MVAISSIGGFLGIGSRLSAVPWDRFRDAADGQAHLAGATRETLTALPAVRSGS